MAIGTRHISAAVIACALLVPTTGHAFRCGNKLITEGMHRQEVIARCGEPASVETERIVTPHYHLVGEKRRRYVLDSQGRYVTRGYGPVQKEVLRQRYLYNFGPNRLMRELRFDDGRLVSITALGYGYRN